eukprot:4021238-Prorocentrum_lima.AAC.1
MEAIKWHDPFWHSKLLAYLSFGISAGWCKPGKGSPVELQSLEFKTPVADTEPAHLPVQQSAPEALQSIRQKAHNTMQLCTWILADDTIQNQARALQCFTEPVRL